MKPLNTLWKFSRPHTVFGTVISLFTLYYIVFKQQETHSLSFLLTVISIGITCNLFIVGINQIADVEIDKINKPYLPIPSGALTVKQAKLIVLSALLISLSLALYLSPYLFGIIAFATAIGWAYSMPPFYLKKHHITAALSIATVRGLLLNAGGFLVFNYLINTSLEMPENVKILTLFIIVFSIVISWFKDLPDIAGDAKYNITTFAIQYSPKLVLITGTLMVVFAYIVTIYLKWNEITLTENPLIETRVLLAGHILLLVLFMINAYSIRLSEQHSIKNFYRRFWWFYFAEYLVYLLAYALS